MAYLSFFVHSATPEFAFITVRDTAAVTCVKKKKGKSKRALHVENTAVFLTHQKQFYHKTQWMSIDFSIFERYCAKFYSLDITSKNNLRNFKKGVYFSQNMCYT